MAAEPVSVRRNCRSGVLLAAPGHVLVEERQRRVSRGWPVGTRSCPPLSPVTGFGLDARSGSRVSGSARPLVSAAWIMIIRLRRYASRRCGGRALGLPIHLQRHRLRRLHRHPGQDRPLGRLVPRMGRHRAPLRAAGRGGRGRRPARDRQRRLAAGVPGVALGQVRLHGRPGPAARRPGALRRLLPTGGGRADPARAIGAHPRPARNTAIRVPAAAPSRRPGGTPAVVLL